MKPVQRVIRPQSPHWVGDGFRVRGYFTGDPRNYSPFVLLDYNEPYRFSPSSGKPRGVGPHPHRGFETVTLVYEGAVRHRDSNGNGGVIGAGEVQWMTAASGVLHEEFHEEQFSRQGGVFHAIQLWVNLPAKDKGNSPRYQTMTDSEIRSVNLDGKGSKVRVIAGKFQGVEGPAKTHTPIEMYDVRLQKGASLHLNLPPNQNSLILVTGGDVMVNGKTRAKFRDLVQFQPKGESVTLYGKQESQLFVISGEPIDEPVVQSGPFVMNSQQEIDQAFQDLREGKFGRL